MGEEWCRVGRRGVRQPCTEPGKSSWCGVHLAEAENMGWRLVLCVPRAIQEIQEQCVWSQKGNGRLWEMLPLCILW